MPNLPKNLVKPPSFDNPLRKTAPAHAESVTPAISEAGFSDARSLQDPDVVETRATGEARAASGEGEPGGVVLAFAGSGRPDSHPDPAAIPIDHRITVRISELTRCALEAECHRRRIAGQKTNVAEIARGILDQWRSRIE
jgi:hypothetical protein